MQGDRAAAIVLIFLSVVFWTQTSGLQYNGAVFPRAIIVFIILLSVGLFVQKTVGKGEEQKTFLPPNLGYVLFSIVIVALWIYCLDILGFIVSSILFLSILTVVIDVRKTSPLGIIQVVAIHAALVGAFWVTFHLFLLVPLPEGYLI